MATVNGRYVKIKKVGGKLPEGESIGIARGWKPESDWMTVHLIDGTRQMVHYTDNIEILPANYTPERDFPAEMAKIWNLPKTDG